MNKLNDIGDDEIRIISRGVNGIQCPSRLDCFFEQRGGVGDAYGNRSIDDGAEAGFCLSSAEQIAFDNECADDSAIIAANIGCLHCQHDIFALQHVGSDME